MISRFHIPTELIFGEGCTQDLGDELRKRGYKNVLVVTDRGVLEAGMLQPVTSSIEASGLRFEVFDEVLPNSPEEIVLKGVEIFKGQEFDGLLGVGGGSSLDAAKAIGALSVNPGNLDDYEGPEKFKVPPKRIVAVPTTAGTGSEVTGASVVLVPRRKTKIAMRSMKMIPEMAFLDPTLLKGLPPHVAAETGLDALSHAIEAYTTTLSSPFTDALAESAIRLVGKYLRPFVANRENMEAGLGMLIASNQAAQAFTWARVGLAHALSIPLGGRANLGHGLVTAILLPRVMKFNLISNTAKYARIALLLGGDVSGRRDMEDALLSVDLVLGLMQDVEIPLTLKGIDVKQEIFDKVVDDAITNNIAEFNPRKVGPRDMKRVLEDAMEPL